MIELDFKLDEEFAESWLASYSFETIQSHLMGSTFRGSFIFKANQVDFSRQFMPLLGIGGELKFGLLPWLKGGKLDWVLHTRETAECWNFSMQGDQIEVSFRSNWTDFKCPKLSPTLVNRDELTSQVESYWERIYFTAISMYPRVSEIYADLQSSDQG